MQWKHTDTQFGSPVDMIAFNENLAAKMYRFDEHEVGAIRKFERERIGCLYSVRLVHSFNLFLNKSVNRFDIIKNDFSFWTF